MDRWVAGAVGWMRHFKAELLLELRQDVDGLRFSSRLRRIGSRSLSIAVVMRHSTDHGH